MDLQDAFLQDIVENPDDDTPRLIYADWLEDHGDADRAEFIRLQIKLSRMAPGEPYRFLYEERVRALLREHEHQWAEELSEWVDGWEFRRGFIEKVVLLPLRFVTQGEALWRLAPVQEVHCFRRPYISLGEVQSLAQSHHLARLKTFKLSTDRGLRDDGVQLLANSTHLARLACLDLSNNWIRNAGAHILAECPYLESLRRLRLSSNPIGASGKRELRARFGDRVGF